MVPTGLIWVLKRKCGKQLTFPCHLLSQQSTEQYLSRDNIWLISYKGDAEIKQQVTNIAEKHDFAMKEEKDPNLSASFIVAVTIWCFFIKCYKWICDIQDPIGRGHVCFLLNKNKIVNKLRKIKMQNLKSKTMAILIALLLTFSMTASMALLPNASASSPPQNIPT